jgi:hypothetical protein
VKSSLLPFIELDGTKTTEPKSHTSIRASVRNRCAVSNHLSKSNDFYPYTVSYKIYSESVATILKQFIIGSSEDGLFAIGER